MEAPVRRRPDVARGHHQDFTRMCQAHLTSAVDLNIVGRVPGLDAAAFAEAAAAARLQVLRSGGARQDLPGELRAKLEPST
jgi:hypothetical protein